MQLSNRPSTLSCAWMHSGIAWAITSNCWPFRQAASSFSQPHPRRSASSDQHGQGRLALRSSATSCRKPSTRIGVGQDLQRCPFERARPSSHPWGRYPACAFCKVQRRTTSARRGDPARYPQGGTVLPWGNRRKPEAKP